MQRVDAIVLSVSPYSETSLIVRALTSQAGVVRAMAKGARRPKSTVAGVFEPFQRIAADLALRGHDELGTFGQATIEQAWPRLRADVSRLAWGGVGLEIIGRIAEHSPVDPFFFHEGVEFLDALETARGAGSLTIALLMRLLHQGGFPPGIDPCLDPAAPPAVVAWDFEAGAFVSPERAGSASAMQIPGGAFAAIAPAFRGIPELRAPLEIRGAAGPVLARWLMRVWEDHLGARLKSADFLEKMVFLGR